MKGETNAVGLNCCSRKIQHGRSLLNTISWWLQQCKVATLPHRPSLCSPWRFSLLAEPSSLGQGFDALPWASENRSWTAEIAQLLHCDSPWPRACGGFGVLYWGGRVNEFGWDGEGLP